MTRAEAMTNDDPKPSNIVPFGKYKGRFQS